MAIFSCSEPDLTVDPQDANALSKAITLNQRPKVSGDLPASSTDPAAPVLKDSPDSTFMLGWSHANIRPTIGSGEIIGYYVQVKGADHHYKIESKNATVNSGGVGFGFVIENSSKPGKFTIRYSVFDSKGRTSNIVEQQIYVVGYGGPESLFPAGQKMSAHQFTTYLSNKTLVQVVGTPNKTSFQDVLDCTGQPDKKFENVSEDLTSEYTFVFSSDGSGTLLITTSSTTLDRAASQSACSPKYVTTKKEINLEGKWGYMTEPNRLLFEFDIFETINGSKHTYDTEDFTRLYSVFKNGSQIIWKSKSGQRHEIIFK